MRKFMDIVEAEYSSIDESPIADIQTRYDPDASNRFPDAKFGDGTAFSDVDKKLLKSPKAIQKIVRAFKRTPFVFEVFFMDNDEVEDDAEHNNYVDDKAKDFGAGIKTHFKDIVGKPNVIRVVVISNLSPLDQKMPLTAWTLAHKIGHTLQDAGIFDNKINKEVKYITNIAYNMVNGPTYGYNSIPNADQMHDVLTMKSARNHKLTNAYEIFPELIAQFLITGKITVNKPEAQKFIDPLTAAINGLLQSIVGKVMLAI